MQNADNRKERYIKSVVYRYGMMMTSFFVGLSLAALLPFSVLMGAGFQLAATIAFLSIFFTYMRNAVRSMGNDTPESFFTEKGFSEAAVGFATAFYFSSMLLGCEMIVPGSLLVGVIATAAVVLGSVTYVVLSKLMGKRDNLDYVNGYARGCSKFLLSILVAAIFVKAIGFLTGIYVLAYAVEFALFGVFSLMMVGNVYTILDKGHVELQSRSNGFFGENVVVVDESPSIGAIVMFANTIDLFVTAVRLSYMMKVNKESVSWEYVVDRLLASGMLLLAVLVVRKMVTDSLDADKVMPPAYVHNDGVYAGRAPEDERAMPPPSYEAY